jgi:protein ImuA
MKTSPLPGVAAVSGGLPVADQCSADILTLSKLSSPALRRGGDEQATAKALVARLRAHIAKLENTTHQLEGRDRKPVVKWLLGVAEVDSHLTEQGLARHALHDIAPQHYGDTPAAMGFALGLAERRLKADSKARPVLWCRLAYETREHGRLYGHGLVSLGFPREKLLTLSLKSQVSLLWTVEEALKSGCFACVISDVTVQHLTLTITRRMALSADEGKTAGILVLNRIFDNATASASRWQVATQLSPPSSFDPRAPGPPSWEVTLSRIRSGRPGQWSLCWQPSSSLNNRDFHASHHFSLVPGISGGALPAGAAEIAGPHTAPGPALRAG